MITGGEERPLQMVSVINIERKLLISSLMPRLLRYQQTDFNESAKGAGGTDITILRTLEPASCMDAQAIHFVSHSRVGSIEAGAGCRKVSLLYEPLIKTPKPFMSTKIFYMLQVCAPVSTHSSERNQSMQTLQYIHFTRRHTGAPILSRLTPLELHIRLKYHS